MCFVVIGHRLTQEAAVLVAANREELFARQGTRPALESGPPKVLCGRDPSAGGTWLGINEFGVLVAVTNRHDRPPPAGATSRGLLCRRLLDLGSASEIVERALEEISSGQYAAVNVLAMDGKKASVVHGGAQIEAVELAPGLHILTNGEVDDARDIRQSLARGMLGEATFSSVNDFLVRAGAVCRKGPDESGQNMIVLRGPDRGTVSSAIVAIGEESAVCRYYYSAGPPDEAGYEDLSGDLRACLAGRERN